MRTWLGRGKTLQAGITICCLVAFILYGYDQGVLSGILQNEDFLNQFNHPSDSETGIIVSCFNLGCLAGCFSKYPALPFSRKPDSIRTAGGCRGFRGDMVGGDFAKQVLQLPL